MNGDADRWTLHIDLAGSLPAVRALAHRLLSTLVGDPAADPYGAHLTDWVDWTDIHGQVLCGQEIPDAGLPWCGLPAGHDDDCLP